MYLTKSHVSKCSPTFHIFVCACRSIQLYTHLFFCRYAKSEIRFNLLAIIGNIKQKLTEEVEALTKKLEATQARLAQLQQGASVDGMQRKRGKEAGVRKALQFLPFTRNGNWWFTNNRRCGAEQHPTYTKSNRTSTPGYYCRGGEVPCLEGNVI